MTKTNHLTQRQIMIYKALHRKVKIRQHDPY